MYNINNMSDGKEIIGGKEKSPIIERNVLADID